MSPELTNTLYERYPKIFAEHTRPESRMADGFVCGDGWFDLIDGLCSLLQFEIDQHGAPQIVVAQIKGKFGTLRFRAISRTDRQDGMIQLAELMSARICDLTGRLKNTTKPVRHLRFSRIALSVACLLPSAYLVAPRLIPTPDHLSVLFCEVDTNNLRASNERYRCKAEIPGKELIWRDGLNGEKLLTDFIGMRIPSIGMVRHVTNFRLRGRVEATVMSSILGKHPMRKNVLLPMLVMGHISVK